MDITNNIQTNFPIHSSTYKQYNGTKSVDETHINHVINQKNNSDSNHNCIIQSKTVKKQYINIKSLCIPKTNMCIDKYFVESIFQKLNIGRIERVDEVINKKNMCKKFFIHFKFMFHNDNYDNFYDNIQKLGYVNIVYDFPSFWKCFITVLPKRKFQKV